MNQISSQDEHANNTFYLLIRGVKKYFSEIKPIFFNKMSEN